MIIQRLNNTCSLVHLAEVTSRYDYNIQDAIRFRNFLLLNEVSDRVKCVMYICSDNDVKKQLKKIGFRTIGSYTGWESGSVSILGFYPKRIPIKYRIRDWFARL